MNEINETPLGEKIEQASRGNRLAGYLKAIGIKKGEEDAEGAGQNKSGFKGLKLDQSNSVLMALAGPVGNIRDYFFPVELIGGCCPRVPGEEMDIVWNAAAEAADSERVHIFWQSIKDKVWFLAVPSDEMASHPGTWCPLAAYLPGMPDAAPLPACYTYYSDEVAILMIVTEESLNIHRGTTSVIRAKVERTLREWGGGSVVELLPDRLEKLSPLPWFSVSLFEERARRILASFSVLGAIGLMVVAVIIWFAAVYSVLSANADIKAIRTRTEAKSLQLMQVVQELRASPMREQLAAFADVNDGLLALNGWLDIYQIKDKKAFWRAIVPSNVTSDRIKELGGQTLDNSAKGVVIGNSAESLQLGKGR